jgi:hypothetical protein
MGEIDYTFPPLNIGQIEDMAEFTDADAAGNYLDADGNILRGKAAVTRKLQTAEVLFRRASPPIPDVRELECTSQDLNAAMVAIYRLSGMIEDRPTGEAGAGGVAGSSNSPNSPSAD